MITDQEKRAAAKLYSMLYNGANIYYAKTNKNRGLPDPVMKFALIARELNQYMKEIENV